MSNRTTQLVAAVAIALLALPAAAGSWPNIAPRKVQTKVAQVPAPAKSLGGFVALEGENLSTLEPVRYFTNEEKESVYMPRVASNLRAQGVAPSSVNGFEYVGGEPGWQPVGHKFLWSAGSFAHSEECDHAIRVVRGPTAAEMEATNALSPGA
jgi:hypothetical protein